MFGLGKKKDKKQKPESKEESLVLTEERKKELAQIISQKAQLLDQAAFDDQAKIHEEIGLALFELGEDNQAIDSLEKSIELKKSIGSGYKTLLKLYNRKRAEAAREKDSASLQMYLTKMDHMMQVSKDVTRGVR